MQDRRKVDDLSVDELQRVLLEKKRSAREARLAQYRDTGRALPAVPVGVLPDVTQPGAPRSAQPRSRARRILDGLLLLLEVAAVIGLVYIFYTGATVLSSLNREAEALIQQSVQALPTIAPTPIVTTVVLPGGHKPPDGTQEYIPNFDEVPANLRSVVAAMPPPVIPTQGPQQATRIIIPALNVDAPIYMGDGPEQLKKGVGQYIGSGDPGQPGNLVLSAHNDIYGEIFRYLDQLQPGDEVQIQTLSNVHTYVITGWREVAPTEISVLTPTTHSSLTLISCYPYLVDDLRIVVTADLQTD
ncbi:MAG: sortase [Anaerolineales bacterium]